MNSRKHVALITGASDRIGAVIAKTLARDGVKVIIHYRSSHEKAETVAKDIRADGGVAAICQADLSQQSEVERLIDAAGSHFGPLDVLVNNASTFEPDSIQDLDAGLWNEHFGVHVVAPVFLTRDFSAQVPDGVVGSVVNIIDERVLHLSPAYFSYTLSKAALWDATRMLAQSLAPRVRVNAIAPGPTLPHSRQTQHAFEQSIAELPLQVSGTAEDIANAVAWINRSRSMTGQMIALDGGEHIEFPAKCAPTPRTAAE